MYLTRRVVYLSGFGAKISLAAFSPPPSGTPPHPSWAWDSFKKCTRERKRGHFVSRGGPVRGLLRLVVHTPRENPVQHDVADGIPSFGWNPHSRSDLIYRGKVNSSL